MEQILGGDRTMRRRILCLLLAIWMIGVAFVSLTSNAKADDNYTNNQTRARLNSNNYPGGVPSDWYAPGDNITGYLEGFGGPDTIDDTLDVVVADDDPMTGVCDAFSFDQKRLTADNVVIDPDTGRGSFSLPGLTSQYLSDGHYCVWIAPDDYLESGGAVAPYPYSGVRNFKFEIHLYWINIVTERAGYIPGNTVKVFYTVSKIKDGSLVTDSAFTGHWLVQSTDSLTYVYSTQPLTNPTGYFTYTIVNNGGVNSLGVFYPTYVWYNGTVGGATRTYEESMSVPVDDLVASIDSISPSSPVAPGTLLQVNMRVYVDVSGDPGYAGANVQVNVLNGATLTSPVMPVYLRDFVSDANGRVYYIFLLNEADFLSGRSYTIKMDATSILKTDTDSYTFSVISVPESINVQMHFDKITYYSGDTVTITVVADPPPGHSQPSTYVYTVSSGSMVFARSSSTASTFTFDIPTDFSESLDFRVDAYNVEGDYGSDTESRYVYFGRLLINLDPETYEANNVITVNFELVSTVMNSPSFFYKVYKDWTSEIAEEGSISTTGKTGSFTFTVPSAPETQYRFYLYATQAGHYVYATEYAYLRQGYVLTISFDRDSYMPGDTMTIHYTISPKVAGDPLPSTFYFQYALWNYYPAQIHETTASSGDITYHVPSDANEGYVVFEVYEGSTGASADEVIFIGQRLEIGGIELFDAFLLVLIVILFLLLLAFRFRGPAAAGKPKPPEEKAAPPPRGPEASPMSVNCKSCGAPIEITTSKRPIEVMCPSCGETEMVK